MTPGARAARERKQKIFLIVGGLFLAALLAIQLPKLLGGSSSSSAAPTTTETTGLSGAPAAAPPTTATATPTTLLSGMSPSPQTTRLTSFSRFAAKDPFVQQVKTETAPDAGATPDAGEPAADEGKKPAAEKQTVATPSKTFTTVKPAKAPAVTIVTVNGTRQILATGMKFPAADPLFVLVAEKQRAKSVVIGVAGGAYAGGSRTTILRVGKSVTLVNTATGARYEISLVSVGSGEAVARPAPDAKKP